MYAPLPAPMPVCPRVSNHAQESELLAGEIIERLHLTELRDRFNSEPSALNSSKFGRWRYRSNRHGNSVC
jgi:hypothetical protein